MTGRDNVLEECLLSIEKLYEIKSIADFTSYRTPVGSISHQFNSIRVSLLSLSFSQQNQNLDNEIEKNTLSLIGNSFTYYYSHLENVVQECELKLFTTNQRISFSVQSHNEAMQDPQAATKMQKEWGKTPVMIDTSYQIYYEEFVRKAIDHFSAVLKRHVDLFKAGKLTPNDKSQVQKESPVSVEVQQHPKLKFKFSKPYVAYLFKMLFEHALLDVESKEELYRFVEACVTTPETEKRGKTTAGGFRNDFDYPKKETAEYWVRMFETMRKRAEREEGKKRKK